MFVHLLRQSGSTTTASIDPDDRFILDAAIAGKNLYSEVLSEKLYTFIDATQPELLLRRSNRNEPTKIPPARVSRDFQLSMTEEEREKCQLKRIYLGFHPEL